MWVLRAFRVGHLNNGFCVSNLEFDAIGKVTDRVSAHNCVVCIQMDHLVTVDDLALTIMMLEL